MAKNVRTTDETPSGRNIKFVNTGTGETMSRAEFVRRIENGHYPDYHIRNVNGVKTPASNPDRRPGNNLD